MPRTKQFCETAVLEKAMELFWEKGFHATSIQHLVAHLGINRASLYDTYGGKEALFKKAFKLYQERSTQALAEIFTPERSVKEGFRELFEMAIMEAGKDTSKKGCFVVNTITELVPGNSDLPLLEHKNYFERQFVTFVQMGMAKGEIPSTRNAAEIGLMLYALFCGLRVVSKLDSRPEHLWSIVNAGLSVMDGGPIPTANRI